MDSSAYRLLIERFLSRRSPATRATYLQSITAFARWIGAPSPDVAASWILSATCLEASAKVSAWLDDMAAAGLSQATLAARLAAIRSVVQLGRLTAMVDWSLEVPMPKVTPLRDTAGPGRAGVQAILRAAAGQASREKGARDVAILRLMYDLGLRRGEVAGARAENLDLAGRCLWVSEKGRPELARLTLPDGTAAALKAWLSWRGEHEGPLFYRLDNAGENLPELRPLTGRAIWDLVHELGAACGIEAHPHGFRHSAITDALDAGFDIRTVQRFSRHRKPEHVIRYDDNRKDLGASVSARLSLEVGDDVHRR